MEGEFLGVGRTFILTVLALVSTVALILAGKIPDPISLEGWGALVGVFLAGYTTKSVFRSKAEAKKGG